VVAPPVPSRSRTARRVRSATAANARSVKPSASRSRSTSELGQSLFHEARSWCQQGPTDQAGRRACRRGVRSWPGPPGRRGLDVHCLVPAATLIMAETFGSSSAAEASHCYMIIRDLLFAHARVYLRSAAGLAGIASGRRRRPRARSAEALSRETQIIVTSHASMWARTPLKPSAVDEQAGHPAA
jgi:hypothetical protein